MLQLTLTLTEESEAERKAAVKRVIMCLHARHVTWRLISCLDWASVRFKAEFGFGPLLSAHVNPDSLPSQVFAESIFQLVRDKYAALADARGPASHARPKFLAGIVMTRGERMLKVTLASGWPQTSPQTSAQQPACRGRCAASPLVHSACFQLMMMGC